MEQGYCHVAVEMQIERARTYWGGVGAAAGKVEGMTPVQHWMAGTTHGHRNPKPYTSLVFIDRSVTF